MTGVQKTGNRENSEALEIISLGDRVGEVTGIAACVAVGSAQIRQSAPLVIGELLAVSTPTDYLIGEVVEVTNKGSGLEVSFALSHGIDLASMEISRGIRRSPPSGAPIYRPHERVVQAILEERATIHREQEHSLTLSLGVSPLSPKTELSFTPERLLGRHCAIVGSSGSGKSWTLARLLEQCSASRAKVIVIDPSGEYQPLSSGVKHISLGTPLTRGDSEEVTLPYYELTETDLVAILRPTSATQVTKLRAAIRTLKVLQLAPHLGVDGTLPKSNRLKIPYESALFDYRDEIARPENLFNISRLGLQIGLECVDPIRSQTETSYWGGMNTTDHSECVPLIYTLEDLLHGEDLNLILKPDEGLSVFDAIRDFLSDNSSSILRISCENLPTVNRVREIVANALARFLLGLARQNAFRDLPLILAVDEAHQMLPTTTSPLSVEYPLEAFNVIAKEGRKYGLTLCLATQRPRDIPEDVLSQVGTFIVHRLVSDGDRQAIERASGSLSQAFSQRLPLLPPGEAYVIGIEFPSPLRLRISRPHRSPVSNGPDFQSSWTARDGKSTSGRNLP